MIYDGNNPIEFIKSNNYRKLNLANKRRFILSLFHSINFEKIKGTERIILLQELENVIAELMVRKPYELTIIDDPNLLLQLGCIIKDEKIYVDKLFLEKGIAKNYTDEDGLFLEETPSLNVELLDSMFHEHHHIYLDKLEDEIREDNRTPIRECFEDLLWMIQLPDDFDFQDSVKDCYYAYRMVPQEYYAFKYAEEQVKDVFAYLETIYGHEPNLKEYLGNNLDYRNFVCKSYSDDHHMMYGYDELYQVYLKEYIKNVSRIRDTSEDELIRELNSYLPFTDNYKKKINRCLN